LIVAALCERRKFAAVSHAIFSRLKHDLGQHCRSMTELKTIGYEGLTIRDFIDLLKRCCVSMIVDVRELPISRKPGFAKAALAAMLEKHGIRYQHVPELGCPKQIRHDYRDDGDWARYSRRFKSYLETQAGAIERLIEWAGEEQCCLLCFEEDYNFCHRSYVAEQAVLKMDGPARIHHLTGPMSGRVVQRELVTA
jgi:uncharacterized protein YeaO (DUF488 family)